MPAAFTRFAIVLFTLCWFGAPGYVRAGDQIAPDVLKKTKKATVYLRVTLTGGRVLEGSGFFGGAKNVVITNAHVLGMLSPDGRPPQKIEVVVDSGEKSEKKYAGQLLQVDPNNDLAAVRVSGDDLPEPLTFGLGKNLVETQSLFIFGFPFGKALGKNITVSRTTVSSLRKNPNGTLRDIQVNGGMNPGNSGGPVIDAKGQAVGISVAGVAGTQINFAIPGETARAFLLGRVYNRTYLAPYEEAGVKKLPVIYSVLDPLITFEKFYVEVWTGKPGPERKGVAKIGVEPQPEDSEKTRVELTYKDRVATGELVIPPIPKGKVMWVQYSFKRQNGPMVWGSATVYANTLVPVERKPVTLTFQHRPENPSKVLVTATTDLKIRALDGTDKHLVTVVNAELLERQIDAAGKDGAAPVLLTFKSLAVKQTFDKEELVDKELAKSLTFAKAISALTRVDKQGDLDILKLGIDVKDKDVKTDLAIFGVQTLQYLEAVTVPLPGREVVHEKPWKHKREISLGSGRSAAPGLVDVEYSLHGVRDTEKQKEALVFLKGEVRGQKGGGSSVAGRLVGQGAVNLKTNQILFAEANLNLDLDLPTERGGSIQANGTLKIVLQRTPLAGKELADALMEIKGKGSSPPPKDK